MQIVSSCISRDLPVYRETYRSLRRHLPGAEVHVITRHRDFDAFRQACGSDLVLWDEESLVPGMTMAALRELPLPFFPKGAGWYFQQFLKFAFVDVSNDDPHYVIWDADTVLLRPLDFLDAEGRAWQTRATEHHRPYFETFEALFGVPARREYSFISQHQVIEKAVLREMLAEIGSKQPDDGGKTWPWVIMDHLRGEGSNLFSEYETYGHYLKWRHPDRFAARELPWTRDGGRFTGYPPDPRKLEKLAEQFAFAAVEANHNRTRRLFARAWRVATRPFRSDG